MRCRQLLAPLLRPDTVLLTLQNGLGNEEFLAERYGAERVLGGLCFVCLNKIRARRHRAPRLRRRSRSANMAGFPLPRTHDIAWEFKRCGINARVVADLAEARWRKLVWNIPFQRHDRAGDRPTRARTQPPVSTADLLADKGAGVRHPSSGRRGGRRRSKNSGTRSPRISRTGSSSARREMGRYLPSTVLDFMADRPLELEAIWGEPYRRAFNVGAEVGRLETLYHLLRSLRR